MTGRAFLLLLFLLLPAAPVFADMAVIALKETSEKITPGMLRNIYLKRKLLWEDKTRIVPVNLPSQNPLRELFTKEMLRMEHRDLVAYWNEQHYKGVKPPVVLDSEEAVKAFVRQVEGAVGYIDSNNLEPDLKVLYMIRVKP